MPRDNTIQGYHSRGQKGQGEKMQRLKLERIFVARELECGCAWVSWLNVRQSLLGLEDHPKEVGKCKSNHTWEDSLVLLLIYPLLSICVKTFTYQKSQRWIKTTRSINCFITPGNAWNVTLATLSFSPCLSSRAIMKSTRGSQCHISLKRPVWLICSQTRPCMSRHEFSFI